MDLRALTLNVRYDTSRDGTNAWPYRREAVLSFLNARQHHVLGFQEVQPHQRSDLEAGLPDYLWLGHGREANQQGEQCCLAVHRSFELLDTGTFWLCPTPDVAGAVGWDAQLTRICTWARIAKAGTQLSVLNSHWDHRGVQARIESAKLLRDRVLGLKEPVLLMGDFNATPDSEPLAWLTENLQDSYALANPGCSAGTFHGFGRTESQPRIDYLLASREFLVIDSQIFVDAAAPPYLSDHYPVSASYELISVNKQHTAGQV